MSDTIKAETADARLAITQQALSETARDRNLALDRLWQARRELEVLKEETDLERNHLLGEQKAYKEKVEELRRDVEALQLACDDAESLRIQANAERDEMLRQLADVQASADAWERMAERQQADVERLEKRVLSLSEWSGREALRKQAAELDNANRTLTSELQDARAQAQHAKSLFSQDTAELELLRKSVRELSQSNLLLVNQRDQLQADLEAVRNGAQHQINRLNLKLALAPYSLIDGRWVGAGLPTIEPGVAAPWVCDGHQANTTTAALSKWCDVITRDRHSAMDATIRANRQLGRERRAGSHKAQAIRNLQIRLKAQLEERAKLQRELSTERKLRQAYELVLHSAKAAVKILYPSE